MLGLPVVETDVLIIGGGGAGTRAAMEAAKGGAGVVVINKGPLARSGLTPMGGGGLAAVLGHDPQDSLESHFRDTVEKGYFLNDQNLVEALVREAPERVRELAQWGGRGVPNPYLHTAGHSHRRGLYLKGHRVIAALKRGLLQYPNIKVLEDHIATRLLTSDGRVSGAVIFDLREGRPLVVHSRATVLATGGLGELYALSSNAPHGLSGHATGVGALLALEVGAELVDMEMVQFYPNVAVYPPIVRGVLFPFEVIVAMVGAKAYNGRDVAFLDEYFKDKPLVRDVVCKLCYEEIKAGRGTEHGGVYWRFDTSRFSPEEIERLATKEYGGGIIYNYHHFRALGLDISARIEFRPGAHHICGGVHINEKAETSVPGLFAAGEVAGNAHGANRLAGNAFAEFLVFGCRAGREAALLARREKGARPKLDPQQVETEAARIYACWEPKADGVRPAEVRQALQNTMEDLVGPSRNEAGLAKAIGEIQRLKADAVPRLQVPPIRRYNLDWVAALELPQMLEAAEIIARSALARKESRGAHQRSDYPARDDQNWLRHTAARRRNQGLEIYAIPIQMAQPPSQEAPRAQR